VKDAEIQALLNPIIQTIPRTLELPLKVPAQRPRARLVGTAFDYAVRFELQRLSPHARTRPWIAENAAAAVALASLTKVNVQGISTSPISTKVAATYQRIVAEARAFVGAYLAKQSTTATDREEMAKHALRLARLDAYYRNEYLDPEPETIARGDLPDLVALLDIVPWRDLNSPTTLWLNLDFGRHSRRVGGADADLLSGERLLDLKTTTKPTLQSDLRQVIGYFILARAAHSDDPTFPSVSTAGIYYARHGFLWLLPSSSLAEHDGLSDIEKRFFERSDEIQGAMRKHVEAEDLDTEGSLNQLRITSPTVKESNEDLEMFSWKEVGKEEFVASCSSDRGYKLVVTPCNSMWPAEERGHSTWLAGIEWPIVVESKGSFFTDKLDLLYVLPSRESAIQEAEEWARRYSGLEASSSPRQLGHNTKSKAHKQNKLIQGSFPFEAGATILGQLYGRSNDFYLISVAKPCPIDVICRCAKPRMDRAIAPIGSLVSVRSIRAASLLSSLKLGTLVMLTFVGSEIREVKQDGGTTESFVFYRILIDVCRKTEAERPKRSRARTPRPRRPVLPR
jgi:hypothetical protein